MCGNGGTYNTLGFRSCLLILTYFKAQVWEFSESWFTMINISPNPCPNHPNLIQFPTCMKALYRQLYSNPRKGVQESKSSIFPQKNVIPFGNQAWLGNPRTKWGTGKTIEPVLGHCHGMPWRRPSRRWIGVAGSAPLSWKLPFNCRTGEVCTVPGLMEYQDLPAETEGQL